MFQYLKHVCVIHGKVITCFWFVWCLVWDQRVKCYWTSYNNQGSVWVITCFCMAISSDYPIYCDITETGFDLFCFLSQDSKLTSLRNQNSSIFTWLKGVFIYLSDINTSGANWQFNISTLAWGQSQFKIVCGSETNQRQKARESAIGLIPECLYTIPICTELARQNAYFANAPFVRIISILFQKPLHGLLLCTKCQHLGDIDVIEQLFRVTAKIEEHCWWPAEVPVWSAYCIAVFVDVTF